jgi:hypothetical protein
MFSSLSTPVRGAIAGLAGAAAVAAWFLAVDTVAGAPLHTPAFLASLLTGRPEVTLAPGAVALYTVLHFAAFAAIGAGVAVLLERTATPAHYVIGLILGILLFDALFLIGLAGTGVDVVQALGWPALLAANLVGGLAVVTGLHLMRVGPAVRWRDDLRRHDTVRRGLVAGAIGALVVAAWFLIVDTLQGQPLFTPAAIGSALFHGARGIAEVRVDASTILLFTGLHIAAFAVAGIAVAAIFRAAERQPPLLLGLALLFVSFEALFVGLLAIASVWLIDALNIWTVIAANLFAAAAMGVYLWREHPALHGEATRELEERAAH